MSMSSIRYGLVAMTALALSGCYSGGRWTMPDLAFWKTNPFSSAAKSTSPEAVPRPSELASQPIPAPGAGYAPSNQNTANTTAPPYSVGAVSPASQQTYAAAPSSPGATATPYMAPQQGYYGADSSPGASASYPATNSYPVTSVPHGLAAQSPSSYGNNPYDASGGHGSPTPFGAAAVAPQGYGAPSGGASGYVASNPSGPYANPVRDDARNDYDARLADYRSNAGNYGAAIPDYRAPDNYQSQPASDYRNAPAGYQGQSQDNPAQRQGNPMQPQGVPTQVQGVPYGQPGYGSPAVQTAGLYDQPTGGYSPGNTGYDPPGVPPYQSPGGVNSSPAGTSSDPGYSPGSVGRYGSY